jgi:hypothetical protein
MTIRHAIQHSILTMLIVASWATASAAQTSDDTRRGLAESFEQLQVLVRPGDLVTVTTTTGYRVSGRINSVSPWVLALTANGIRRDYAVADVNTVRQRRSDSLANGAKWGASIGAALLAVAIAACDECRFDSPDDYAVAVFATGAYAAMGAGVGVGIDALIRRPHTVYRPPGLKLSFRF